MNLCTGIWICIRKSQNKNNNYTNSTDKIHANMSSSTKQVGETVNITNVDFVEQGQVTDFCVIIRI